MSENGVAVRNSAIHGRGAFARRRFRAGAQIQIARGSRTQQDGDYVLWLEDEAGREFGIDVENDVRYVNHSLRPNAEFDGVILRALCNIQPGCEITAHYGDEWADVG